MIDCEDKIKPLSITSTFVYFFVFSFGSVCLSLDSESFDSESGVNVTESPCIS